MDQKGAPAVSHCYLANAKSVGEILDKASVIPKCERVCDSCIS